MKKDERYAAVLFRANEIDSNGMIFTEECLKQLAKDNRERGFKYCVVTKQLYIETEPPGGNSSS